MKALYFYDGPLKKDENGTYYGIALKNEVFSRYAEKVNKLEIIIRVNEVKQVNLKNSHSKISVPNTTIYEAANLSSIRGKVMNEKKIKSDIDERMKHTDVIIARLPSVLGNLGIEFARKNNIPYIVELVGCPWDAYRFHSMKGKILAPVMYMKTRKNVYNAEAVIYVTKEFLQSRYPTKGTYINCSNVELYDNYYFSPKVEFSNTFDLLDKSFKIASVGAVNLNYKGYGEVIKAISILKKRGYKFEYHLIGGGEQRKLIDLARKNDVHEAVKFHGVKNKHDLLKILHTMDYYIQPSKTEGLPRALIEAMDLGMVCIGSDAGGIPELLDNKYIFKVNRHMVNNIADKLLWLIKNNHSRHLEKNREIIQEYKYVYLEKKRRKFIDQTISHLYNKKSDNETN